jgi:hypothetical protein
VSSPKEHDATQETDSTPLYWEADSDADEVKSLDDPTRTRRELILKAAVPEIS